MGHGKETPRQKMIGMMYLVLTALLALNVSKQVLDAFALVDEGLNQTNENFNDKIKALYGEMETLKASNPVKVGPWLDKANEIKRMAKEINTFIEGLKVEIVKSSDGKETEAVTKDGKIEAIKIASKDNMDNPTRILVGENNNGKGRDLRLKIEAFREKCLSFVKQEDKGVREVVQKTLDTKAPPAKDGVTHSWESEHFGEMPLIAVNTVLSKMQGDIHNVESEMISYLLTQIDAGALKFNKLEATVIPNSSYILKGNEYTADVFISAQDSTQDPKVLVGNYETVKNPDGSVEYKMLGKAEELPIKNGKGVFKRIGGSAGNIKWGGIIQLKNPEGALISYPFKAEYQVAEATAVISPTKMNVFYLGVDNPVAISVPGIPGDKIFPSITNGSITKVGNTFIVKPRSMGNAIVTVDAMIDNKRKNMGSMDFRVKKVPDPVAKVAGRKGGIIDKNLLAAQAIVQADMENFDFDLKFNVTEFKVSATQGGFVKDEISKSNRITPAQIDIIKSMGRGQKVYFEDIKAVGPDGTVRELSTLVFKLN